MIRRFTSAPNPAVLVASIIAVTSSRWTRSP